ncbi:MAG TPA: arginine--tRNA ligase [Pyrinomonadaceae bacterium]|nr:arginine--tRNA ligase [Pyrinomonadaceae bacterium]
MKLIELQERLRGRVRATAQEKFGVALEQVAAEVPPRAELGDLAFPVAFELAKRVKQATGEKRNPRAIAEELGRALEADEDVSRVEVAGAGYLNVFYDRAALLGRLSARDDTAAGEASPTDAPPAPDAAAAVKVIVEHTNINPNKAAHIGHVRNAVLGDAFVRVMRAAGRTVEVENYIDNTGVQVADVVVGFMHIERMTLEDVRALDSRLTPDRPFDYFCWDLYTKVGLFYRDGDPEAKENPDKLRLRADTLHAIEEGTNETAQLADYVSTRVTHCHLDTMGRLGITYDVLPRESEILKFMWRRAFEAMKASGAIRLQTEGRNAGCWVMPMDTHSSTDEHEADKVIVRSNGTITYTGKDIAYQLWKLGQVEIDFFYKPFRTYPDGRVVWVTAGEQQAEHSDAPHFGGGGLVYNVIDSRQSYTQEVVRRGVAAVAPHVGEEASVHLAYEMVALSPAACEELGLELSEEDRQRAYVEMSGRRGLGVKADDLINRLEAGALREVEARHPSLSDGERLGTARAIAVGALRYFLLKYTRNSVIAFDFREALSFEGETGPYCQYAAVRANSIFRKLDAAEVEEAMRFVALSVAHVELGDMELADPRAGLRRVLEGEDGTELWSLVMLAARLDEVVAQSAAQAEPSHLAKYAFQLARAFNLFYHRHRIIAEEDAVRRAALVAIADLARRQLTAALSTLGITVPERM